MVVWEILVWTLINYKPLKCLILLIYIMSLIPPPGGGCQVLGATPRPQEASRRTAMFALKNRQKKRCSELEKKMKTSLQLAKTHGEKQNLWFLPAFSTLQSLSQVRRRHISLEKKLEKLLCLLGRLVGSFCDHPSIIPYPWKSNHHIL